MPQIYTFSFHNTMINDQVGKTAKAGDSLITLYSHLNQRTTLERAEKHPVCPYCHKWQIQLTSVWGLQLTSCNIRNCSIIIQHEKWYLYEIIGLWWTVWPGHNKIYIPYIPYFLCKCFILMGVFSHVRALLGVIVPLDLTKAKIIQSQKPLFNPLTRETFRHFC